LEADVTAALANDVRETHQRSSTGAGLELPNPQTSASETLAESRSPLAAQALEPGGPKPRVSDTLPRTVASAVRTLCETLVKNSVAELRSDYIIVGAEDSGLERGRFGAQNEPSNPVRMDSDAIREGLDSAQVPSHGSRWKEGSGVLGNSGEAEERREKRDETHGFESGRQSINGVGREKNDEGIGEGLLGKGSEERDEEAKEGVQKNGVGSEGQEVERREELDGRRAAVHLDDSQGVGAGLANERFDCADVVAPFEVQAVRLQPTESENGKPGLVLKNHWLADLIVEPLQAGSGQIGRPGKASTDRLAGLGASELDGQDRLCLYPLNLPKAPAATPPLLRASPGARAARKTLNPSQPPQSGSNLSELAKFLGARVKKVKPHSGAPPGPPPAAWGGAPKRGQGENLFIFIPMEDNRGLEVKVNPRSPHAARSSPLFVPPTPIHSQSRVPTNLSWVLQSPRNGPSSSVHPSHRVTSGQPVTPFNPPNDPGRVAARLSPQAGADWDKQADSEKQADSDKQANSDKQADAHKCVQVGPPPVLQAREPTVMQAGAPMAVFGAPTVPAGMPARAPVVVQATALAQATAGVQPAAPVKAAADLPGGASTGMRAGVSQNRTPVYEQVGAVSAAQLELPAGVQSGLPAGTEKGELAGVQSALPAGVQKETSAGMPAGASGGQCRLPAGAQKRVLEGMLTADVQRIVGAPADVQEASMQSQTAPGGSTSLPQTENLTGVRECFQAGTPKVQTPAGMPIWVYRVPAGSAAGEGARLRAPAGMRIGSSTGVQASAPAGMEEGAPGGPQLRVPDKGAVWHPGSAGEATQVGFLTRYLRFALRDE
jgi:hypothetical protein